MILGDVNLKPKNEIKYPTIQNYKIKTAVSGFAKPKSGVYSTKSILNGHFGQFGEDAFFIAEYNDTKDCDENSGKSRQRLSRYNWFESHPRYFVSLQFTNMLACCQNN